ncbi:hypothetical protein SteCoe_9876 [Stentor coeruleus]|uniref:Uncharacterized protein n=1 Tax=Stentor coeruleus TaxID=5963 RepID=A0A1R2CGT1_9CILI|nr:hypothetical protein SteCoe_9876 [Stentor coeruleus]
MSGRSGLIKDTFLSILPKLSITRDTSDEFSAASSLRSHGGTDELPSINDSRLKISARRPVYAFKNNANFIYRKQKTNKKALNSSQNLDLIEKIDKIEEEGVNLDESFVRINQAKQDDLLQEISQLKTKCEKYEKIIESLQQEKSTLLRYKNELDTYKDEKMQINRVLTEKMTLKGSQVDAKLVRLFSGEQSKDYVAERELEELQELLIEEKKRSEQFSELFSQEHKKNVILHDQVKMLNGIIELFKIYENRGNSTDGIVKLIKDKNNEYYSQLVIYSDQVYEKTLENRQLRNQNAFLAKDLRKSQEKLKEIPELRSHVTTLLGLIRKLRQEITDAAQHHLFDMAKIDGDTQKHEDFIFKITNIADQAKDNMVSMLKSNLGRMMSGVTM